MREAWWPDWRGETAVIAASGPSQRQEDLDCVRGKARVVAINCTWTLCPWADALYACDQAWWICGAPGYGQDALNRFAGLKVSGQRALGTHHIRVNIVNEMLWTGGEIGGGGSSAFQATNLVLLWGAERILLTGCDCKRPGEHWHGRHPVSVPMAQTPDDRPPEWIKAWAKIAPAVAKAGVEIVNCTRDTDLDCFPKAPIEDVI